MVSDRRVFELVFLTALILGSTMTLAGCAQPGGAGILVEYRRSGGFLGEDDRLIIFETNQAVLTRKIGRYEFVLDADQVGRLQQQFAEADFTKLERQYLPANTCCDLFEYVITYKGHTVRTMDTAAPRSLQPVLNTLNEIVQSQGKS